MATTTPNIGLTLPEATENVSRQMINGNWELIDTAIGQRKVIKRGYAQISLPGFVADRENGRVSKQRIQLSDPAIVLGTGIYVTSSTALENLRNYPCTITINPITMVTYTTQGLTYSTYFEVDVVKVKDVSEDVSAMNASLEYFYYER